MNKSILRVISKAGFLLVIIGYFMPWGSYRGIAGAFLPREINGFEYAQLLSDLGSGGLSFLIYIMFTIAVIGVIIGIVLMAKKKLPIIVDWLINFAGIAGCIYFFSDPPDIIHSGFYTVTAGVGISTLFTLIASLKKDDNFVQNITVGNKCPFCANDLKMGAVLCQFCGKELPKEQNNRIANEQNIVTPTDKSSVGFAILSFFLPIVGLILFLVWKKDTPKKAKSCGIGALIGFGFGIIQIVFSNIFLSRFIGLLGG